MRSRILLHLALFAAVGAVVTLAVAWLTAWRAEPQERSSFQVMVKSTSSALPVTWLCRRAAGAGVEQVAFVGSGGLGGGGWQPLGPGESVNGWPAWAALPEVKPFSNETVVHLAAGWPARCMRARCVDDDVRWRLAVSASQADGLASLSGPGTGPTWEHAIVLADDGPFATRVLPLAPIAAGFAVDTAFWGGVAYAMFGGATAMTGWIRGRRRRRAGRCPRCDYDLQGMVEAGCSECGWRRQTSNRI